MSAEIRAALEEAAKAIGDLVHGGNPMAEDYQLAAEAIAAFLAARARHFRREHGWQVYADLLESEVAAVEAAAKGEGA